MTKIFNISLHRSGTLSFVKFCESNGLKCQHWPGAAFDAASSPSLQQMNRDFVWQRYAPLVDRSDAFADIPMPFLYPHAQTCFPAAKFLLLKRPVESWITSVRRHSKQRPLDVLEQQQYHFITGKHVRHLDELTNSALFYAYEGFIESAFSFFMTRSSQFMILDLSQPDLDLRLNRFLGFSRNLTFPREEHSIDQIGPAVSSPGR